jgi:hypothetical protein
LFSRSASDEDIYTVKFIQDWQVDPDGDPLLTETLGQFSWNGTTYSFSMNEDSVNGFGNSQFIEEINNMQTDFSVIAIRTFADGITQSGPIPSSNVIQFGDSGYDPNELTMNSVNLGLYFQQCMNRLARFRPDVHFFLITDGGIANNPQNPPMLYPIPLTVRRVANKRKGLGVFTHARSLQDFWDIFEFYNSIYDPDGNDYMDHRLYSCTPWRKSRTVLEFPVTIPMTTEYVTRVLLNRQSNQEFAPVFGTKTGTVSASDLTVTFTHSTDSEDLAMEDLPGSRQEYEDDPDEFPPETEMLQRVAANPAVYNSVTGTGQLVNNLTHQEVNLNNMSEEQNVRLFNKIQFELNHRLDFFLSDDNNSITRELIGEDIDNYFSTVIFPMRRTINNYRYDITPFDPARRNDVYLTVEIQFLDSIKYIKVLYRAIPMT